MEIRRLSGLAAVAAGLLVAACSDDPSNPFGSTDDAQVSLDVASYAAEATLDDIDLMSDEAAPAFPGPAAAPPIGDLTISRQVTFYDEQGAEMSSYDALLTASINIVFTLDGSRSRSGDRGTVEVQVSRSRDMTVSGLLGDETERTWNGTGSASGNRVMRSDGQGDREYTMSATTTIDNVVMLVPRDNSWPLSGTITREITVEVVGGLEDNQTRTRTVVVVFNGTNLVDITINGETFTLDLDTHEIVDSQS